MQPACRHLKVTDYGTSPRNGILSCRVSLFTEMSQTLGVLITFQRKA